MTQHEKEHSLFLWLRTESETESSSDTQGMKQICSERKFKLFHLHSKEDSHNIFPLICGDPHPYVCILPLYKMHSTYKPSLSTPWSSRLKWEKTYE